MWFDKSEVWTVDFSNIAKYWPPAPSPPSSNSDHAASFVWGWGWAPGSSAQMTTPNKVWPCDHTCQASVHNHINAIKNEMMAARPLCLLAVSCLAWVGKGMKVHTLTPSPTHHTCIVKGYSITIKNYSIIVYLQVGRGFEANPLWCLYYFLSSSAKTIRSLWK